MIGFSPDNLDLEQKFTDKEKLNFPLMADPDKKLHKALGVTGRSTWVINKKGEVAKVVAPVKDVKSHPKEMLEFVQTLK